VRVRPAVIQLTNDAWEPGSDEAQAGSRLDLLLPNFRELLGPIEALLASRTGRGRAAHGRLQGDKLLLAGETCLALDIVLDGTDEDKRVPLGWTLRTQHVRDMAAAIGPLLNTAPLDRNRASADFATWRANVYGRPASEPCRLGPPAGVTIADGRSGTPPPRTPR
jgi:hypothetical protein